MKLVSHVFCIHIVLVKHQRKSLGIPVINYRHGMQNSLKSFVTLQTYLTNKLCWFLPVGSGRYDAVMMS
jgi:hypothetical protein